MSKPDHPDHKKDDAPQVAPHFPGAGRSASPGSIGEELGGDLDFEPDALLDSLLSEPDPPVAIPVPAHSAPPMMAPPRSGSTPSRSSLPRPVVAGPPRPRVAVLPQAVLPQAVLPHAAAPPYAGAPPIAADPPPSAEERLSQLPVLDGDDLELISTDGGAAFDAAEEELESSDRVTLHRGADEAAGPEGAGEPSLPAANLADAPGGFGGGLGAPDEDAEATRILAAGELPPQAPASASAPPRPDQSPRRDDESSAEAASTELNGEEDPHDGLESLPPGVYASDSAPQLEAEGEARGEEAWADERPAAAFLSEQGRIAEFSERATWFEAEAERSTDGGARSRALLLASELWAMCADIERARDAAERAVKAAPGTPLATRQVRWLAALGGDLRSVSTALEIETRASATPTARFHAAMLNAEIRRIAFGDQEGALQRADLASRLNPTEPRPHLLSLAHMLASSGAPPRLALGDDPALDTLRGAVHQIARRRGLPAAEGEPRAAGIAFADAQRALARGDSAAAADALTILAQVEGLDRGALWLAASLLAHGAGTRQQAIRLLGALLRRERTPLVVRALLARALEQGDTAAVQTALAPSEEAGAFSACDRVVLSALAGAEGASLSAALEEIAENASLRPLAAAVAAAVAKPEAPPNITVGDAAAQTAVRLGRALAGDVLGELTEAHDAFLVEHGESPLARLLGVELALVARDAPALATQVAAWPTPDDDATADRDRQIVSGLILEAAGRPAEARSALEAALDADPTAEVLARALARGGEPEDAAARLVSLAANCTDDSSQALLLLEAALRSERADSTFEALLRRAAETQPELPFAAHIGELSARRRGDADAVVDWLRLRRLAATDSMERALDAVREALLVADTTPEAAGQLLAEAMGTRPEDAGLHELAERLAPGPGAGKGQWREEQAGSLGDEPAAGALYAVASLEYERSGARDDALRAAQAAAQRGSVFAAASAERLATELGTAELLAELEIVAKGDGDPVARRRARERLIALAVARQDEVATLEWARAILAEDPTNLSALRRLEHALLGARRPDELEPVATRLAELLDRTESIAHAQVAAHLRAMAGRWSEARELVQAAYRHGEPSLWTLRQLSAHARATEDDAEQLAADEQLLERANRAIDAATLALRAGEAAARLGDLERARGLLERAVEMLPEHFVALTTYAEILEAAGANEEAATVLEALAQASQVDAHRVTAWHQAGTLWQDRVANSERARTALEQAAQIDPTHEDAFRRLQSLYVEGGDRAALAELLERRLARTTDADERVRLEVSRGRALAEVGDRAAAKSALAAALDANPDHVDALDAYAELCLADADWPGAEQAWIRLARHATDPERQAAIYRKVGALYDEQLPNPQRAELAYLEVLKRQPNDIAATRRLVEVYGRLGQPERSVELQTELVNRAGSPEDKRDRTLELAHVYETIVADRKQAEATLDKARKAWPHDGPVLHAMADYYQRQGETKSFQILLERSANDARRALHTGRFDPAFFDVLASVAEIRGGADAARIARATVAALAGEPAGIEGAGPAAGAAQLDDLLAPEMISLPFRALLRKSGAVLDRGFAFDLRAIRANPLPAEMGGYANHVQNVAGAFGLEGVEVLTSGALGSICVPASAHPPVLVFGQALLDSSDDAARFFLLLRNLKILQADAAVLSRAAPVDLWPMLAAFLHRLCPSWTPTGVEARRFEDYQQKLGAAPYVALDSDVPALALEVAGAVGSRASQLGTAINQWGNRAALLAVGDLDAALRGIAMAQGHTGGPPPTGAERMKWITRNPEARDLAVFSVSEAYAEARQRLGLEQ